ncbi:hypothetical protein BJ875DRAFT_475408 [Amylocarpus encephaloides]|uniref:Glycosyltransferase family 31 protein n=1 Tax=Amylocarpus encephaloides TaxID=45428 RepID=A0A9P7YA24_9HELO|nr:hypothetical protein BJ875DRAFT_475408 [Amylocarpus encephaloides]
MLVPTTMLPRTPLYRWLAVAFVVALVFVWHPKLDTTSLVAYTHTKPSSSPDPSNSAGLDPTSWVRQVLKTHSVGPDVSYAARTLQYIADEKERPLITEVDHALLPERFQNITIDSSTPLPIGTTLGVHVKQLSRPEDADASSVIFSVSTTLDRFNDDAMGPVKEFTRWLTDGKGNSNGAGLILALINCTDAELEGASKRLSSVGINATVMAANPSLDMPGRYVDLVRMLHNHPTASQRKYFALIDDDTFFPYISELIRRLFTYDYRKPYYIGTTTERVDWILANDAPMAYGGGGVFLTASSAKIIAEGNCLEKREDGKYVLDAQQGDRLLYNCFHRNSEVTLTYEPLLNQMDQFGDPSGFYESGDQPLSLHHFKSWHKAPVAKIHTVADACGEDCVLQRFKFKDNFIISNGYSVAEYPKGIDFDLEQTEFTFDVPADMPHPSVALFYRFGEGRKSLSKSGRKSQWVILDARKERDGNVKQIYLKQKSDDRWFEPEGENPARDSVIVLTWVP